MAAGLAGSSEVKLAEGAEVFAFREREVGGASAEGVCIAWPTHVRASPG